MIKCLTFCLARSNWPINHQFSPFSLAFCPQWEMAGREGHGGFWVPRAHSLNKIGRFLPTRLSPRRHFWTAIGSLLFSKCHEITCWFYCICYGHLQHSKLMTPFSDHRWTDPHLLSITYCFSYLDKHCPKPLILSQSSVSLGLVLWLKLTFGQRVKWTRKRGWRWEAVRR